MPVCSNTHGPRDCHTRILGYTRKLHGVFLWLTSLGMTISQSVLVIADDIVGVFLMVEQYSIVCVCVCVSPLLYPFICGWIVVSASHLLWIVQLWTLGCMHSSELCFSPDACPGVGFLNHMVALFFFFFLVFLRNLHRVFPSGGTNFHSH